MISIIPGPPGLRECFTVGVIDDRQQERLENFRTVVILDGVSLFGHTAIEDNDG